MYPLTIVLGIAFAQKQAEIVLYALPLVAIGALFSVYHIWIQDRPHDTGGAFCGPTSCVSDVLNAFGFLTVPMLALTAFLAIGFCLFMTAKAAGK